VAGLGNRAMWGIPAILARPDLQLVALIDCYPVMIRFITEEFNLNNIPGFTTVQECLSRIDFDALAVFSPDGTHAELLIPSLEADKWVFVDKPLEITNERIDEIIQADDRANGKTFVGLNLRFTPVFKKVRELVDAGVIGRVLTIQQDEFYDGGRTYFRRWNRLRKSSGGLWITKACHDFDIMYWMVGARPLSVCANASLSYYTPKEEAALHCRDCKLRETCPDAFERSPRAADQWGRLADALEAASGQRSDLCLFNSDKDTFDHGAALVAFEGGIVGTYTVNVVCGFENRRLRVSGTRATIDADFAKSQISVLHRDPQRQEQVNVPSQEGSHGGADSVLFASFVDFVRGRSSGAVTPREGAVGVRIGLAAQKSCDESRIVYVDPVSLPCR